MQKASIIVSSALLILMACNGTSPEEESHFWEDFSWIHLEGYSTSYCNVSIAVHNDSLYMLGIQEADTSDFHKCDFPDMISLNIYDETGYMEYTMDVNRALTADLNLHTDDLFGEDVFGNDPIGSVQADTALGGTNDVVGVFFGQANGDSTLVFRKAVITGDAQYDTHLLADSTYGIEAILQWGNPEDSLYNIMGTDVNLVTI